MNQKKVEREREKEKRSWQIKNGTQQRTTVIKAAAAVATPVVTREKNSDRMTKSSSKRNKDRKSIKYKVCGKVTIH